MLRSLLLVALFLPAGALAQEGKITYEGQLTMRVSLDGVLASMPEDIAATMDSSIIEMGLASLPTEGITTPINWVSRFSGQAVLGKMDVSAILPSSVGGGAPAMTPFSADLRQFMNSSGPVIYIDYEAGVVVTTAASGMSEPYIITQDLETVMFLDWEIMAQDSTILGYPVLRAAAEVDEDALSKTMSTFSASGMDFGMNIGLDSARIEVWFSPDLPTLVGPYMIGPELPGAVLHMRVEVNMSGNSVIMEIAAAEITTTLDDPVVPPTGTPIEMDDYLEITKQRMDMMMQQFRSMQ